MTSDPPAWGSAGPVTRPSLAERCRPRSGAGCAGDARGLRGHLGGPRRQPRHGGSGPRRADRQRRPAPARAPRALLVATGFAICGASAVAAMKDVADGDDDDTAVAVALVTLCGSIAIFVLPALRGPLGLDVSAFGTWAGASVHDVGQTRRDGEPGARCADGRGRREAEPRHPARSRGGRRRGGAPQEIGARRRRVRSRSRHPGEASAAASAVRRRLPRRDRRPHPRRAADRRARCRRLGAARAAHRGARRPRYRHHLATLRRTAGRSLLLALISWLLVAGVAYAGVVLLGA